MSRTIADLDLTKYTTRQRIRSFGFTGTAALIAVIASGCSGAGGAGGGVPTAIVSATPVAARATPTPIASRSPVGSPTPVGTPTPVASRTPVASPTPVNSPTPVPPQGIYNSCEIDTALTTLCEQEDAAIALDGYKWEVDYIGLLAHETGAESLQAWFTYDAGIGLGQLLNVKAAVTDSSNPTNVLTATGLVNMNGDTTLANDCGAVNNQQVIQCIVKLAATVPGFNYKWYLYDEPGCPNQTQGYCQAGYPSNAFNNIAALANYIHSIDPNHPVIGANFGATTQSATNDLFSWLLGATTPATLWDSYPYPTNITGVSASAIGYEATYLANTVRTDYPSESIGYIGQAFSWFQEGFAGCSSVSVCPFPTTAQLQDERDEALYYANKAGKPLSMILWYDWPDITCVNDYSGCNAALNRASLRSAAFAPFPVTAPSQ